MGGLSGLGFRNPARGFSGAQIGPDLHVIHDVPAGQDADNAPTFTNSSARTRLVGRG